MDLTTWLASYLSYVSDERGVSRETARFYSGDLNDFLSYLSEQGIRSTAELKPVHLTAYLNDVRADGKSASTMARRVASIRSFCKYLAIQRAVDYDPSMQLRAPKSEKKPPKTMKIAELDKLLDLPDAGNETGLRDKAMLELMYATGLRVSELVALDQSHVRLDLGFLLCLGSGGRERMVPIGAEAKSWMARYLEESRPNLQRPDKPDNALFLNHLGTRLTRQGLWKTLRGYAARIGIDATPHTIRHSFASHLLENGADVRSVQELLGQAAPIAAQRYLSTPKPRLTEEYERNHPRAKTKP